MGDKPWRGRLILFRLIHGTKNNNKGDNVVFEAHILYYAYDNVDGDDFGVGYIGNLEDWVERVNRWGRQDGTRHDFTVESWDEVTTDNLRGCLLAEAEPDGEDYIVSINEAVYRIKSDNTVENTPQLFDTKTGKPVPVPRWVTRLKNAIKEHKNQ